MVWEMGKGRVSGGGGSDGNSLGAKGNIGCGRHRG